VDSLIPKSDKPITDESFEKVDVNVSLPKPSERTTTETSKTTTTYVVKQGSVDKPEKSTEQLPEAVKVDDKKTKKDKKARNQKMTIKQRFSSNHKYLKHLKKWIV
jgi:hypothetical protein